MAIRVRSKTGYVNVRFPQLKSVPPVQKYYAISDLDVENTSRVLENIPAGYLLKSIIIKIDTAFDNDVNMSISVDSTEILASGIVMMNYTDSPQQQVFNRYFDTAGSIVLNFTGSHTQGSAKIFIEKEKRV
jgi:hypothetical protein